MFSSVELAGRTLNLFDLFNLQLDTDLFSITGCGTSLGTESKGDEILGLTRGLLYAGARSILLPLWNPDQESVAKFMTCFYGALSEGRSKAEALQDTMRQTRALDPNPFRWAAYVLVGESG
jgi:CHAT domain-containing protein